ncbi:MAG: polysaccharide biosynthesis tyrosine autokinase [Actinomycetota bacterium]
MSRTSQESPSGSLDGSLDLRDLVHTVVRRKWTVLAVVVLVTSLAAAYSYSRPKVFSATAGVLASPTRVQPTDTDPLDNLSMPTEAELVRSTGVATNALKILGGPADLQDMINHVSVATPENTQILQISFTDNRARAAQHGAQAFAQGYLQFKAEQAQKGIEEDANRIEAEILRIDTDMSILEAEIAELDEGDPERTSKQSERDSLEDVRAGLRNQLVTTNTSTRDPGEVVQPAERPSAPISPKHQVDLALGFLLGLAAGVALASVREQMRDRIDDPSAFRKSLMAPTLGIIPESAMLRGDVPRLVTIDEPRSQVAEAYRTLRTNLLAACKSGKERAILVTGARQGEGKTTTAVNLAVTLAQAGRSVVLMSADLRFPRLHALLGLGNEQGLGQVLLGSVPLNDTIVETSVPNLRVLPTGPVSGVDEPVELLQSDRMFEVIRRCRQADFVIVDGPPIEPFADSLVLADVVDGVLFVADAQDGTRASVSEARHQLEQVGGNIVGGVLNRVQESRTPPSYGSYEQKRRLLNRDGYEDADRELASLREEATRSSGSSARV